MADPHKQVSIAVVGAGSMANQVHYPSLAGFDDVRIVGVCDLDEQRLRETAQRWNIDARFTDYRRMIEQTKPDGVYVIGQPNIMFDIWVLVLQQGLPLFIEKPMGITMHQAEVLAHLAARHGNITQVGHQRRSAPLLRLLRDECAKRGPIVHAVCEFFKYRIEPDLSSRGHMMDDCVHSIDTVRWMCGGEVVGVESRCKRVGVPDINWIGATLQFDNGSTGMTVNSWCSGRRVFRVQMHGPGVYADAEVEGKARLYAEGDYEGVEYDTREVAGGDELYIYGGFRAKNREFIDSIKSGRQVTSSPFSDCLKTMRVAEQILAAAVLKGD